MASLLGSRTRVGTEHAAFANAMAAQADEIDDSHVRDRFHPGYAIVPVAPAVVEETDAPSEALLEAIVASCDVGARSTIAPGCSSPGTTAFSTHFSGAPFEASATLDELTVAPAMAPLSFAVLRASGLSCWNRDIDHVEKSFDFGARAARDGILAVRLARAGMTAPDLPITGQNGHLYALAENEWPKALAEGSGERFEIERSTVKKRSAVSPVQSVLDAIETLFRGVPASADKVASVTVRIPSDRCRVVNDRHVPAVCCQHPVAPALSDGKAGLEASRDHERVTEPAVLAWREKIAPLSDEELARARPERQSIVPVGMADGTTKGHRARIVRGMPDRPTSPEDVRAEASDVPSGVPPSEGRVPTDACFREKFAIQDAVEASILPKIEGERLQGTVSA